jgi:hypothetical protein
LKDESKHAKSNKLMAVVDQLNEKFADDVVFFAGERQGKKSSPLTPF